MARIAVVEDETDIRDLLTALLTRAGHEVVEAASGEEALKLLHDGHPTPQLVLMDISLRGLVDGLEVVRQLRKLPQYQAVPIVALSAHAMRSHQRQSLEAGCDHHWVKPIADLPAFMSDVSQVLDQGRGQA